MYFWSLADLPDVPLIHYGKQEVIKLISSMEPEFTLILRWMGSTSTEVPGASTQWGHSFSIFGNPKRITGSLHKVFCGGCHTLLGLLVSCDQSSNWSLVICTGCLTCYHMVTYIDIHLLPCTLLS